MEGLVVLTFKQNLKERRFQSLKVIITSRDIRTSQFCFLKLLNLFPPKTNMHILQSLYILQTVKRTVAFFNLLIFLLFLRSFTPFIPILVHFFGVRTCYSHADSHASFHSSSPLLELRLDHRRIVARTSPVEVKWRFVVIVNDRGLKRLHFSDVVAMLRNGTGDKNGLGYWALLQFF